MYNRFRVQQFWNRTYIWNHIDLVGHVYNYGSDCEFQTRMLPIPRADPYAFLRIAAKAMKLL